MKIENQKLNISEAFGQYIYNVPDYQREYIWKEKNVAQLLDDINEEYQNNGNSEYFIGSIVVHNKGNKEFEVIDGQQRLTTLFLCLCAFKDLLKDNKAYQETIEKTLFSAKMNDKGKILQSYNLILQYQDSSKLIQDVVQNNEINYTLRDSAKRIFEAYNYLYNYLKTEFKDQSEEELTKFLGYFANKVNFIQIETTSISDALKTFETINERGVGLDPMDLLKNLIFRQLNRDDFEKLKADWKYIIDLLESAKEKKLRFLRYFIMANYEVHDPQRTGILREDQIYDWISKNNDQCHYTKAPFDFVNKIKENTEAYVRFSKCRDYSGNANIYLENIKFLGGSSFSQHLILLLPAKNFELKTFNLLASSIEDLIFYYTITRTQSKELERKFSRWAKELNKISKESQENQERLVTNFVENVIKKEIKSKSTDYKFAFLNLRSDSLQIYKFKYILAKIAQYVDTQRLGQQNTESLKPYLASKIEIEHILPNKPESELLESFGSKEEYDEYKIKLGNFTLLEKPINVVAGRNFFENKKKLYIHSKIYLTKSIANMEEVGNNTSISRINHKLLSFDEWNKNSINQHQEMYYNLALEIWKI